MQNLKNLYGVNEWGILVNESELAGNTELKERLTSAGFERIEPISGSIYMDESGEYCAADHPIWFMPITQPGLFEAPYDSIEDIEAEFAHNYPELDTLTPIEPRLCRLNIVCCN